VFLYRANGMNYTNLIRLKWSNIKGKYIVFTGMKTENTRKNNVKEISVPTLPPMALIRGMLCARITKNNFGT